MNETKTQIYNLLKDNLVLFKPVSDGRWYMSKCPFCGDVNDHNRGHMYICIDPTTDGAIGYYCHRCNASGYLTNKQSITKFIGEDVTIDSKLLDGLSNDVIITHTELNTLFPYEIPSIKKRDKKIEYIEKRIGKVITDEYANYIRYIPSVYDFIRLNDIKQDQIGMDIQTLKFIESSCVSFLSNGNSHLIYRVLPEYQQDIAWFKVPITKQSSVNTVFYSLPTSINPYEYYPKSIILSEGIFDTIGIRERIMNTNDGLYIATTSNRYDNILKYLIHMGIFGSDVDVSIFSDNDEMFNNKKKKRNIKTSYDAIKTSLGTMPLLFKDGIITIYYNQTGKDYGDTNTPITLKKIII